jgi:hypothetical protein
MALPIPPAAADDPAWPTRAWAEATPEARGLDRAALESLDRDFASGKHGYVDGLLVVRGGSVVFERSYRHDYDRLFVGKGAPALYNYYDPEWHPYWKRGPLHTMQSVPSGVASTLVAIALRRGEYRGRRGDALILLRTSPDPRRQAMTCGTS